MRTARFPARTRRTLAGSLRGGGQAMAAVDEEYRALHAMIGELDRLLSPNRPRRPEVLDSRPVGEGVRLRVVRGGRGVD